MQAIKESNEHLKTLAEYMQEMERDEQAHFELEMAAVKANQAIAHAVSYLGDMIHNLGIRLK